MENLRSLVRQSFKVRHSLYASVALASHVGHHPADQHARARHEAATGHPVKLADAGHDAGKLGAVTFQANQPGRLALGQRGSLGARHRRLLLDNGVPAAATIAAAGPLRRDATTGLADEV